MDYISSISAVTGIAPEKLRCTDPSAILREPSLLNLNKRECTKLLRLADFLKAHTEFFAENRGSGGEPACTPETLASLFRDFFSGIEEQECLACAYLDAALVCKKVELVSKGSINEAHVPIPIVLKHALLYGALNVAVAHNHSSQILRASKSDESITRRLYCACDLVGIQLVDHFIFRTGEFISLKEKGVI